MPPPNLRIMLLAGEPSGDAIGAQVMRALQALCPRAQISFSGVGGPLMSAEGLTDPVATPSQLSAFGPLGSLLALPRTWRTASRIASLARLERPHAIVGIDYKGFNVRALEAVSRATTHGGRLQHEDEASRVVAASARGLWVSNEDGGSSSRGQGPLLSHEEEGSSRVGAKGLLFPNEEKGPLLSHKDVSRGNTAASPGTAGAGPVRVQIAAPSSWAWAGGARMLARFRRCTDAILVLHPWEADRGADADDADDSDDSGVASGDSGYRGRAACRFVGHPAAEGWRDLSGAWERGRAEASRRGTTRLLVLPGSRGSELEWSDAVFAETVSALRSSVFGYGAGLEVVVPVSPSVAALIPGRLPRLRAVGGVTFVRVRADGGGESEEKGPGADTVARLASSCDAALVKSGTGSLQTAVGGCPTVVAWRGKYRAEEWVMARAARVPHASLANLVPLLSSPAEHTSRPESVLPMPELLGIGKCKPPSLASAVDKVLRGTRGLRGEELRSCVQPLLSPHPLGFSHACASEILSLLQDAEARGGGA